MGNMEGVAKLRAVFLHGVALVGGGRIYSVRGSRFHRGVRPRSVTGDGALRRR